MNIISKALTRRKIYQMLIALYVLTSARVRLQFGRPAIRFDGSIDHSISDAVKIFFEKNTTAQAGSFAEAQSSKIYQWLCVDAQARNDRKLFFRILHCLFVATNQKKEADNIASQYRSLYQKKLEPMDISALSKEHSLLRDRVRSARRALRNAQAWRLNFRLKDFALIPSVMSVAFLSSGYMYTSIVYGHFGIDATKFFTLGDYLAGSMNKITLALFGVVYLIVIAMPLLVAGHASDRAIAPQHRSRYQTYRKFSLVASSIAVFAFSVYHFDDIKVLHMLWMFSPIFIAVSLPLGLPLATRLATRVFANPVPVIASAVFALVFFAFILAQSYAQISDIEKEREQKSFIVETVYQKFTDKEHVFLGGNDRYIFLLDKKGDAEIIPLGVIKKMIMSATP